VLLYLGASEGGGGVQGLLNLRLVCRTTKGWVDDLSPHLGQRVFSRCHVRVDLVKMGEGKRWKSFFDFPPHSAVTSLCLIGVEKLHMLLNTNSSLKMWSRFTDYWSSKLKSLEVNRFPIERNCLIRKLLGSKEMEHFRVEDFHVQKSFIYSAELMFNLKFLRIDRLEMDEVEWKWFFNKLFESKSLRVIDLTIQTVEDLDTINSILRARKGKSILKMIFRIFPFYIG